MSRSWWPARVLPHITHERSATTSSSSFCLIHKRVRRTESRRSATCPNKVLDPLNWPGCGCVLCGLCDGRVGRPKAEPVELDIVTLALYFGSLSRSSFIVLILHVRSWTGLTIINRIYSCRTHCPLSLSVVVASSSLLPTDPLNWIGLEVQKLSAKIPPFIPLLLHLIGKRGDEEERRIIEFILYSPLDSVQLGLSAFGNVREFIYKWGGVLYRIAKPVHFGDYWICIRNVYSANWFNFPHLDIVSMKGCR